MGCDAVQEDGNVALYGEGGQFSGWATNTGRHAISATLTHAFAALACTCMSEQEDLLHSAVLHPVVADPVPTYNMPAGH